MYLINVCIMSLNKWMYYFIFSFSPKPYLFEQSLHHYTLWREGGVVCVCIMGKEKGGGGEGGGVSF